MSMTQTTLTETMTDGGQTTNQTTTVFEGEIDATLFEAGVRHLVGITETASVSVEDDAFTIQTADESHDGKGGPTVAGEFEIPSDDWDEFTVEDDSIEFGVRLYKGLYKLFTGDGLDRETVRIEITDADEGTPDVTVGGESITVLSKGGEYPGPVNDLPGLNLGVEARITDGYRVRDWLRGEDSDKLTISAQEWYVERGRRSTGASLSFQPYATRDDFDTDVKTEILDKLDALTFTEERTTALDASIDYFRVSRRRSERLEDKGETVPLVDGPDAPFDTHVWSPYRAENVGWIFSHLLKPHTKDADYLFEFDHEHPLRVTREFDDLGNGAGASVTAVVAPVILT